MRHGRASEAWDIRMDSREAFAKGTELWQSCAGAHAVVLLFQYADYQRRCADHICPVYVYGAWNDELRSKTKVYSAVGGNADDSRQFGQYADAYRESAESVSLYEIGDVYRQLSFGDAALCRIIAGASAGMGNIIREAVLGYMDICTGRRPWAGKRKSFA